MGRWDVGAESVSPEWVRSDALFPPLRVHLSLPSCVCCSKQPAGSSLSLDTRDYREGGHMTWVVTLNSLGSKAEVTNGHALDQVELKLREAVSREGNVEVQKAAARSRHGAPEKGGGHIARNSPFAPSRPGLCAIVPYSTQRLVSGITTS